jgi:hypothetical protein
MSNIFLNTAESGQRPIKTPIHVKRQLECLVPLKGLVLGGWLLVTPPGNDVTRQLREWSQEESFDTLQQCASYREKQVDELIKRMETVPEGSPDYKIFDRAFHAPFYWGNVSLVSHLKLNRRIASGSSLIANS